MGNFDRVRNRIEPALQCLMAKARAVCSVACLEWNMRIGFKLGVVMAMTTSSVPLKYILQKRLRDSGTAVENT